MRRRAVTPRTIASVTQVPSAPDAVRTAIAAALREDCADGDVTSRALVPADAAGSAMIRAKATGVVAGLDVAAAVFAHVDPRVRFQGAVRDGDRVAPGAVLARVAGPLRSLLAGERTAVNFVQRMSGVATLTAQFVDAVRGTRAQILATRKTAPGLRAFDLAAVRAGGGDVHRGSLADRVLVKENHLQAARAAGAAKSMTEVVELLAREKPGVPVGIEAVHLDDLRAALVPGVDVVLLDNFAPDRIAEAVRIRDAAFPRGGGPRLEASGGVTLDNVRAYAETGVERISVGALTHSAPALDVSMKVLPA
jgi:nicotinate-nucleotide pyrophosphorylase (carboxylating)